MCGLEEVTNPPSPPESRYKLEATTRESSYKDTATYDDEPTSSVLIGGGWHVCGVSMF